jgi:hypothetical protein
MFRFKVYQNLNRIFISIFLLFFIGQFIFWFQTEKVKPDVYIVPPLPSLASVQAFSFGDEQFYFRILALRIENAGDSFGRFSSLKNYDYATLYQWFKILDSLDNRSIYIPTLAASYFSQTQNKEDTRYIVQYLDEFASQDIDKYWWWMVQAFYIANSTLKDYPLALKLAYKLSENKNETAPVWIKQLPAFVQAKLGEDCAAFLFINKIIQDDQTGERKIAAEEMEFMRYFIKQRLDSLKKKNFDPNQCK